MENIALGGFDRSKPNNNVRDLIVRLADCGASKCTCFMIILNGSNYSRSQQTFKPRNYLHYVSEPRSLLWETVERKYRHLVLGHNCQ